MIFELEFCEATITYSSKIASKFSQFIPGIHDSPIISYKIPLGWSSGSLPVISIASFYSYIRCELPVNYISIITELSHAMVPLQGFIDHYPTFN